jgi:hypothetical protein
MLPSADLDLVERLHAAVDDLAAGIAAKHGERLHCKRGCSGCCQDDLAVFEIEAAVIARRHARLLAEGAPHPVGRCAFLDDGGACRIYANRPYVCRTQGLPLRWIEEREAALVELRDVCPLNDEVPLEEIPAEDCWSIGPVESKLASLQAGRDGGELRRVKLRTLFDEERPK